MIWLSVWPTIDGEKVLKTRDEVSKSSCQSRIKLLRRKKASDWSIASAYSITFWKAVHLRHQSRELIIATISSINFKSTTEGL
jgi:hypothetical protein